MQVGRLLHYVFTGEVVTALLQHLVQGLAEARAVNVEGIGLVALGIIFVHEGHPVAVARVILPLRIGRTLEVGVGDDALALFLLLPDLASDDLYLWRNNLDRLI